MYMCGGVYVYMCACERERVREQDQLRERERESERVRERERERERESLRGREEQIDRGIQNKPTKSMVTYRSQTSGQPGAWSVK